MLTKIKLLSLVRGRILSLRAAHPVPLNNNYGTLCAFRYTAELDQADQHAGTRYPQDLPAMDDDSMNGECNPSESGYKRLRPTRLEASGVLQPF